MAADGAFFPALARLHPRYATPSAAIVLQSAIAIVYALTVDYGALLDTVVFADWIFFGLSVAGLFVLRPRLNQVTGYRTPGYPWLPALFVAVSAVVVYSAIQKAPWESAKGAGLLLIGVPIFYLFKYFTTRRALRS
jgi:APA family basic amino acid/polyamine antiporter